jgi:hypothetical protein
VAISPPVTPGSQRGATTGALPDTGETMSPHPSARDERFRRLYAEHFDALLGYAL